jgi:hypothetical protein
MDEVEQGVHVVHGASHVPGHAVRGAGLVVQGANRPRFLEVDKIQVSQLGPAGRFHAGEWVVWRYQQHHRPASELDSGDGAEMILGRDEGEVEATVSDAADELV